MDLLALASLPPWAKAGCQHHLLPSFPAISSCLLWTLLVLLTGLLPWASFLPMPFFYIVHCSAYECSFSCWAGELDSPFKTYGFPGCEPYFPSFPSMSWSSASPCSFARAPCLQWLWTVAVRAVQYVDVTEKGSLEPGLGIRQSWIYIPNSVTYHLEKVTQLLLASVFCKIEVVMMGRWNEKVFVQTFSIATSAAWVRL